MKATARSFVSSSLLGTNLPHSAGSSDECTVTAQTANPLPDVGEDLPLTDEQREAAAFRAGVAMMAWYSHFKSSGKPEYLDLAYHFLGLQKTLLAGRSAEFVAKLEADRGLT